MAEDLKLARKTWNELSWLAKDRAGWRASVDPLLSKSIEEQQQQQQGQDEQEEWAFMMHLAYRTI